MTFRTAKLSEYWDSETHITDSWGAEALCGKQLVTALHVPTYGDNGIDGHTCKPCNGQYWVWIFTEGARQQELERDRASLDALAPEFVQAFGTNEYEAPLGETMWAHEDQLREAYAEPV